jgi:hypothetical protein
MSGKGGLCGSALNQRPRARPAAIGIEVGGSTPEALQADVIAEFDKWAKIPAEGNLRQD